MARALVRHAEQVAATRGPRRHPRCWPDGAAPHAAVLAAAGLRRADRDGPLVSLVKVPVEVGARSADEARALGARLAEALRPGDLVILSGDLRAGKTTFTKASAPACGCAVTSRRRRS